MHFLSGSAESWLQIHSYSKLKNFRRGGIWVPSQTSCLLLHPGHDSCRRLPCRLSLPKVGGVMASNPSSPLYRSERGDLNPRHRVRKTRGLTTGLPSGKYKYSDFLVLCLAWFYLRFILHNIQFRRHARRLIPA